MARDCRQQAVRQLNLVHCYELNSSKHRGRVWAAAQPPRVGMVRAEPGVDREETLADLAQRGRRT